MVPLFLEWSGNKVRVREKEQSSYLSPQEVDEDRKTGMAMDKDLSRYSSGGPFLINTPFPPSVFHYFPIVPVYYECIEEFIIF